jgi:mannosyl-3-phosphoglycerate phosphatase
VSLLNANNAQPIIFTDLDGTLLDHHSYSFAAAQEALVIIRQQQIPLIINSSKTLAEILPLQEQLGIRQPLICENGAAVYWPKTQGDGWQQHGFSLKRSELLELINSLREQYGFKFSGFADMDVATISDVTGLSLSQAVLAAKREFSEPLQWQDSEPALVEFLQHLARANVRAQQGGRFLTVTGDTDKAMAMAWLCQRYRQQYPSICTIALGDSPNDLAMLNYADIAVVIASERSAKMGVSGPSTVIRTKEAGPIGWQLAMDKILPNFNTK